MNELEQLTATQLREAAEVLGEWIAGQRHESQVAAEVLDEDGAPASREWADRVEAARVVVLTAEVTCRVLMPNQVTGSGSVPQSASPDCCRHPPHRARRPYQALWMPCWVASSVLLHFRGTLPFGVGLCRT